MPRPAKLWQRKGRPGWYATLGGRKVQLGLEYDDAIAEFYRRKGSRTPVARSGQSVRLLVDLYLSSVHGEIAATTHGNYLYHLKRWVAAVGGKQASSLIVADLTNYLKSQTKWGPTTRSIAAGVIKTWSRWCRAQGYLENDPMLGAKRPKARIRDSATPAALETFLAAIGCPKFREFCLVLLDTGCRPGEVRSLTASQIDWEQSTALVRGKTGERLVSLTARSLEILRRNAELWPDGPVLRGRDGQPWQQVAMSLRFQRVSRKSKTKITAYMFRHDFWRRASKAGISDIVTMHQLGHKNLRMLAKTYSHPEVSQLKDAVERAQSQ